MLYAPGNTDNGYAQQNAKDNVAGKGQQTAADKPQDIKGQGDAARRAVASPDGGAEGPQAEQSDLARLPSPGQSDDGDCQGQTGREITYGGFQTAENQPKNITNDFHAFPFFLFNKANVYIFVDWGKN